MRPMTLRKDPAPSVLAYRLQRWWLSKRVRRTVRLGPIVLIAVAGASYAFLSKDFQSRVAGYYHEARHTVINREEFRVAWLQIDGASEDVKEDIANAAGVTLPASSLDLDVAAIKTRIAKLPAIADVSVRIGAGGVLQIDVLERTPVAVWRVGDVVSVLDADGFAIDTIARREDRPDLPLVIGLGADDDLDTARALFSALAPVADRLRALQRVGERRWTVILDRAQTIKLPENAPLAALRRAMALQDADGILDRDVLTVDMRDRERPVLRITSYAVSEVRRLQELEKGSAK